LRLCVKNSFRALNLSAAEEFPDTKNTKRSTKNTKVFPSYQFLFAPLRETFPNSFQMHANTLWTSTEYDSLENCLISSNIAGTEVSSTIIGVRDERIFKVDYLLKTNHTWATLLLEINCRTGMKTSHTKLEGDGNGNWKFNGEQAPQFTGCLDVDIPLTPFTNTLPIRRLGLTPGASSGIRVIYCDVLAGDISIVKQFYSCISNSKYHYENVPNDFEADIEVDETGLVTHYPSLFTRKAIMK
jgi:hypothetical protein